MSQHNIHSWLKIEFNKYSKLRLICSIKYLSSNLFYCDICGCGGLLISSKQWFDNLSEELDYSLSIVIDVDGKTDQIFDFPDQSWNNVWTLEANKWLSLTNSGILALILFGEGTYNISFYLNNDLSNDLSQNNQLQHFSNLKFEDKMYITEADDFLISAFSDVLKHEDEDFEQLNIPVGFYQIYCSSKKHNGSEFAFDIVFHQVESLSDNNIVNEIIRL